MDKFNTHFTHWQPSPSTPEATTSHHQTCNPKSWHCSTKHWSCQCAWAAVSWTAVPSHVRDCPYISWSQCHGSMCESTHLGMLATRFALPVITRFMGWIVLMGARATTCFFCEITCILEKYNKPRYITILWIVLVWNLKIHGKLDVLWHLRLLQLFPAMSQSVWRRNLFWENRHGSSSSRSDADSSDFQLIWLWPNTLIKSKKAHQVSSHSQTEMKHELWTKQCFQYLTIKLRISWGCIQTEFCMHSTTTCVSLIPMRVLFHCLYYWSHNCIMSEIASCNPQPPWTAIHMCFSKAWIL